MTKMKQLTRVAVRMELCAAKLDVEVVPKGFFCIAWRISDIKKHR